MSINRLFIAIFVLGFLAPLAAHAAWWLSHNDAVAWHEADWSSVGLLPPARANPDAEVYVFAARTGRWKGIFAHHSWIVIKERGAPRYTRYDMVGWGNPIKVNNWAPDARWYGDAPTAVGIARGAEAERLIPKIQAAVASFPFRRYGDYSVWPGPNSNSFISHILAAIPEARITLLPTAIGKDWRADGQIVGLSPSRTGVQIAFGGVIGLTVAWIEGVEINLLGLVLGVDVRRPAIKLPGFGRIGMATTEMPQRAPDLSRSRKVSRKPATNPPT
jgi:hypothetical protein